MHIRVPASSANLGPGYDSFGLALGRYDEVIAEPREAGLSIAIEGVGAGAVPTDENHLVYQAASRAFSAMNVPVPGLHLTCTNCIPHGGGQGSSAAAIVAGILLARAVTASGAQLLSDDDVFALATEMEGHPDNVAPALWGGFTVAWMSTSGSSAPRPRTLRLTPHSQVRALVLSAEDACSTTTARAALPVHIPHADAAANSARAAILVHAMTHDPALLFDATEDYLHQRYREEVMPQTADVLHRLRAAGLAAVLSGAGPSVLVLGTQFPDSDTLDVPGFQSDILPIPVTGASVNGRPFGSG